MDAVVGEALRGGVGVIGPEDVVEALNQGRVHRLVLEADFDANRLAVRPLRRARRARPAADVPVLRRRHARGARARRGARRARAVGTARRSRWSRTRSKLHSYRGVAAFLRQTAPTGLRGASPPWPTAPGANQS